MLVGRCAVRAIFWSLRAAGRGPPAAGRTPNNTNKDNYRNPTATTTTTNNNITTTTTTTTTNNSTNHNNTNHKSYYVLIVTPAATKSRRRPRRRPLGRAWLLSVLFCYHLFVTIYWLFIYLLLICYLFIYYSLFLGRAWTAFVRSLLFSLIQMYSLVYH